MGYVVLKILRLRGPITFGLLGILAYDYTLGFYQNPVAHWLKRIRIYHVVAAIILKKTLISIFRAVFKRKKSMNSINFFKKFNLSFYCLLISIIQIARLTRFSIIPLQCPPKTTSPSSKATTNQSSWPAPTSSLHHQPLPLISNKSPPLLTNYITDCFATRKSEKSEARSERELRVRRGRGCLISRWELGEVLRLRSMILSKGMGVSWVSYWQDSDLNYSYDHQLNQYLCMKFMHIYQ